MTRCIALVILALTLTAVPLHAQNSVFTVTVQSADVHKGPTTGSPVIGHASRDTVLTVARNLGSWSEVLWPDSPNGVGYVHVTMGRLGAPAASTPAATAPAASTAPRTSSPRPASRQEAGAPAPARTPAPVPLATTQRAPVGDRVPSSALQDDSPISHIVGVGGMVGSMSSWGATARWWRDKHVGVQVALTRDAMTSDVAPGRVTSMQIEPGVVYALFDRVPGYVWIRPYVGSALMFRRQTLKDGLAQPVSDSGFGYRVFGGTELTFAGVTQFGISAELGYRRQPTPFAGFDPDRFGVAIAGHWYIK
jgi:hypothetical protein